METALLNLIGFAMAHAALARKQQRTTLLAVDGTDVIAGCLKSNAVSTAAVIERTAGAFWHDLASLGLPREKIAAHLESLADAIKTSTACDCGRTAADDATAGDADQMARTFAATIQKSTGTNGTEPESAERTLRSLFAALLGNGDTLTPCLESAAATIDEIIAATRPRESKADSHSLQQLQHQLSTDTGISRKLLEAIIFAQARLGSPLLTTMKTLVDRTVIALELLADLMLLADRAGSDDDLEAALIHVADLIRKGRLGEASCDLATVSRGMENSNDLDQRIALDLTGTAVFPLLLSVRARLAGLDGEPREAARLFERAAQIWPREDRVRRWRLKIAQARQIAELGRLPNSRINVLCEAAQIYASAGGLVSERDCPFAWAEANLELGLLLLQIGDRECRPERYLAAALHFKPAIEVFTRERAIDGWARAQIGLGHALRGQAGFQGDVVVSRDAAFAYRAALGILTEGGTPELWHETRCALGEVLVRIAEESGDVGSLQRAVDILMPYAQGGAERIGEPSRTLSEIATGRAMLFLVDSGRALDGGRGSGDDDMTALTDAIVLIGTALERDATQLTALDRAYATRAHGMALTLLHERTGDLETLEQAVNSKIAARDLYEHIDNPIAAEDLRLEIESARNYIDQARYGERGGRSTATAVAAPREREFGNHVDDDLLASGDVFRPRKASVRA